ncbi:MAG: hypothetical protein R6U96_01380 [Promethearchaeia archaeon]
MFNHWKLRVRFKYSCIITFLRCIRITNLKKKISTIILLVFLTIIFITYFSIKKSIPINELDNRTDFSLVRTISIVGINFGFLILMFLIDIHYYKRVLIIVIVIGILVYVLKISGSYVRVFSLNEDILEFIVFLTYAIVPPGIICNTLYYIRRFSNEYIDKTYGERWHIHESFLGILLISGGMSLIISNHYMNSFQIFHKQLNFVLSITSVFPYFFLFFGGFLLARDWNDFIHLQFVEKNGGAEQTENEKTYTSEVFSTISIEDIEFFERTKHQIYPLGLILTTLSLSFVTYSDSFLPSEIFFITARMMKIIGYVIGFTSGAILGKDWVRLFGKFYPQVRKNLDKIIKKLKKRN